MPVHVLTHPACREHRTPDGREHVERPARLEAARKGLAAWPGELAWDQAPMAKKGDLMDVHIPEHVERVERRCAAGGWFDSDTYAVPESWDAAVASAGGALRAGRLAADGTRAISLTRPPGHHATASQAMGFCLFNNVAAAAHDLTRMGLEVAIVDIDVHHGNGTQDIFYERGDVLYVSLHQSPFYPGTGHAHEIGQGPGRGYTVNLPVPSGTGHAGWLELIERVVLPVLDAFEPDVILVSAGYDAHALDPIGGLELVAPTYHACLQQLLSVTGDLACILEGGYSLEALGTCLPATAAALAGQAEPSEEPITQGVRPWGMLASPLKNHVAEHWPVDL